MDVQTTDGRTNDRKNNASIAYWWRLSTPISCVLADLQCFVNMQMFNFLVLGVDSVSRLNFARHMPRTRRFLVDELGAVELAGFNKVNKYISHYS